MLRKKAQHNLLGLKNLQDLIHKILDKLSAFCQALLPDEPTPVKVYVRRGYWMCLTFIMLAALSATSIDETDLFPALHDGDLPILAQGIPNSEIVLDGSLCDLSESDESPFISGNYLVERNARAELGTWL